MRRLTVHIEIQGSGVYVGDIVGNEPDDAIFTYSEEYLTNSESVAVSLSLPLEKKKFDAKSTRNFFEGLLPEGFTRRCVAEWMHVDENDYLSILAGLGNECLGAIKICDNSTETIIPQYHKLTETEVKNLAKEGATESAQIVTKSHLSLTGASGKVGLYYSDSEKQWYLPIGEAPSTHIVKQSHVRLKRIVTNEQLCLLTARNLGIEIPESFIINTGSSNDEDILFATKRYDRKISESCKILDGLVVPHRLHQEDFAQALGIPAAEKYEKNQERYLKKIFEILRNYSADPIADQIKLWDICIFNYLVGNTDNHIKNLSLIYGEDVKTIRLAPAYDIVSTMIYENSTENMALSIDGLYSINDIKRESFAKEAAFVGLGTQMAVKRFDMMVSKFESAMQNAKTELEKQGYEDVESIYDKVMKKGGIKFYRV